MTPLQKIQHLILIKNARFNDRELGEVAEVDIELLYEALVDAGDHWDAMDDLRCSGIDTNLPCPSSRHYESKSVGIQYVDGSWVGWVYWYGGGKHSDPESIDWMDDAYDLTVTEEDKVVTVRTFRVTDLDDAA